MADLGRPVQTRAEVLAVIAAHREELYRLGVAEVWIFGSAARDELRSDSDVDILLRLAQPLGLEFFDIAPRLEAWLGRQVDVGTFRGLNERLREQVTRDAIHAA